MGLRCLLSHDFGEPELEREREEQGNEVVITVNEVKTCTRCGERRVVSENTEVTSMEQLTETATAADTEAAASSADADGPTDQAPPQQAASTPPAEADSAGTNGDNDLGVTIDESVSTTDDAEVWTDEDDEPDDLGTAEPANMTVDDVEAAAAEATAAGDADDSAPAAADTADGVETAEDDGVILSDDDEEGDDAAPTEREPGEWPEYDTGDDGDGEATEWPDVEGDDEGYSAEEPADGEPEDMTFGGGFTPEITNTEAAADSDEPEMSFTRAEESTVEYEPTVDDIETEFYCPECGFSRLAGNSSMRAGDICPDCKRGYISERPV